MNAIAASRHEEFAGRLQSTGNKAELYTSPADTGSNSRWARQKGKENKYSPLHWKQNNVRGTCVPVKLAQIKYTVCSPELSTDKLG